MSSLAGRKPLDVGNGRVAASFDPATAGWLSIGSPHPAEGFVELNAAPAFDEAFRGDPAATRRYRESLADGAFPFLGVLIDGAAAALEADPSALVPSWRTDGLRVSCEATPRGVRQRWRFEGQPVGVSLRLRGRLDRPALAEITELDPPPPTGAATRFAADEEGVVVRTELLQATVRIRVSGAAVGWQPTTHGSIGSVTWSEASPHRELVLDVGFEGSGAGAIPPSSTVPDALVARALAYVRGCTALATGPEERVILTDHRLLPLSWTRDAYWQALALLADDISGDREIVADHLRWLWRRCERPDGRWVRSHHADGRRKDLAFQADQQLYPLIELADYWRRVRDLPAGVDWGPIVARAWDVALEAVDPATSLLATDENAADDPATAPFIAASQILLWYTARRVGEMVANGALRLDPTTFSATATAASEAFARHFAAPGEPWPYAVDGLGATVGYHDANDLPVALAPLWGFCAADDPGWQATMAFAFSPANPAFVSGRRSGLGSAHTPGIWTLGDLQAWIRARASGDEVGVESAAARLAEAAFDDGMLPEVYEANGEGRVRTWFAWPGAAYAALTTLEQDGRLATIAV